MAVKRILLLLVLAGLASSLAVGAPLCTVNGTLQSYITGFNSFANACQIGDKLFWNFSLSAGVNSNGSEPDANHITVQPVPGDGLTNVGIAFNSALWVADPGFPIDAILQYDVATLSGSPIIKDASLIITGTLTGVGAAVDVLETLTPAVSGSPLHATLPNPASVNILFLAQMQSTFHVKDEINVGISGCGACTGVAAHVSIVENDFSEAIPEPEVAVLVGSGLLVFGLVRRRRRA